jgi:hypothetical protein
MIAKNVVSPHSVRVWRGFQLPTLSTDQFCSKLGTVFVPATVKMQIDIGLQSYTPAIPAGLSGKPASVPDETALLFWESPEVYWNGFITLAVRTYTLTHGGCYITENDKSRADFPELFSGQLTVDKPVYLFDKEADWMSGSIRHTVGARPSAQDPVSFRTTVATALGRVQKEIAIDGAIACAGDDYLVYWELGPAAPGLQHPPTGIPIVQAVLDWKHSFAPAPTYLPVGLWDNWAGMDVVSGSSFNMQFTRRVRP